MINLQVGNFNENTDKQFYEIAHQLLNKSVLKINNKRFLFTDIEFYWHSDNHPDVSTYKRIHTKEDLKSGDIFFHYSGFDICLDNDFGRGGILVRGIFSIEEEKHYIGPLVCAMKVFSAQMNISGSLIDFRIETLAESSNKTIHKTIRKNLGKNATIGDYHLKEYRFFIKPSKTYS